MVTATHMVTSAHGHSCTWSQLRTSSGSLVPTLCCMVGLSHCPCSSTSSSSLICGTDLVEMTHFRYQSHGKCECSQQTRTGRARQPRQDNLGSCMQPTPHLLCRMHTVAHPNSSHTTCPVKPTNLTCPFGSTGLRYMPRSWLSVWMTPTIRPVSSLSWTCATVARMGSAPWMGATCGTGSTTSPGFLTRCAIIPGVHGVQ